MANACEACERNHNPAGQPGGRIASLEYWNIDHVREPVPVAGWILLTLKRHSDGVLSINEAEAAEFGTLLHTVPKLIQEATSAAKVYVCSFCEGCDHLHVHLIPRVASEERRGKSLFEVLFEVRAHPEKAVPVEQAIAVAEYVKKAMK